MVICFRRLSGGSLLQETGLLDEGAPMWWILLTAAGLVVCSAFAGVQRAQLAPRFLHQTETAQLQEVEASTS